MKDGPQLLREVHVERIFVLEPVEGEHLTIPLRFVNSYEDVHRVIHLACLGSQSARYIESRSYELDESLSNQTVDPYNFHTVMKDGKTLEMTILIQIPVLTIGICPRCELEHPVQDAVLTSWTRCRGCNAQFSFSEVQNDAGALSGAGRILTSEKALSILGAHTAMLGAEPLPSPMFRRMRIKT
ncbi:hypothetical protein BKA70DRAFT_460036 [Coprinopsis sp. MPI-PUGE-AT-0042]|nr:hypothetical protein BKA70DRAFT_460036 [Coprinopsis sp. MPI-PUGE-AT-0042]